MNKFFYNLFKVKNETHFVTPSNEKIIRFQNNEVQHLYNTEIDLACNMKHALPYLKFPQTLLNIIVKYKHIFKKL